MNAVMYVFDLCFAYSLAAETVPYFSVLYTAPAKNAHLHRFDFDGITGCIGHPGRDNSA
jgi:hypothetical protein